MYRVKLILKGFVYQNHLTCQPCTGWYYDHLKKHAVEVQIQKLPALKELTDSEICRLTSMVRIEKRKLECDFCSYAEVD